MKAFNLIFTALGGALVIVMAVVVAADYFLDKNTAMVVVVPVAMLIGMNARRSAEKYLGYTLLDAMRGDKDESDRN